MSEYCAQCAKNLFGDDPTFNDAKGLITKEEVDNGLGATFLCEGCGQTLVDHEGNCMTDKHGWSCDDPTHNGGTK